MYLLAYSSLNLSFAKKYSPRRKAKTSDLKFEKIHRHCIVKTSIITIPATAVAARKAVRRKSWTSGERPARERPIRKIVG